MNSKTGRNEPCGCGSGKKYKHCCGSPKVEARSVRAKDMKVLELTPGLADRLAASLDPAYQEHYSALISRKSTKEAEGQIAAIPEDKRYLTRVLNSLESAFADFDSETAKLDLPHMQNRKPEAIKGYLEVRLQQLQALHDEIEDYVEEATAEHS
jgi:23S rRNA A2030 N6-methylase RlmJ